MMVHLSILVLNPLSLLCKASSTGGSVNFSWSMFDNKS
jgi:hypothetical protein